MVAARVIHLAHLIHTSYHEIINFPKWPNALRKQVLDIQRAVAAKLQRFVFEGTEMALRHSAWCAITMNPGYAGRSELPDNLKVSILELIRVLIRVLVS